MYKFHYSMAAAFLSLNSLNFICFVLHHKSFHRLFPCNKVLVVTQAASCRWIA